MGREVRNREKKVQREGGRGREKEPTVLEKNNTTLSKCASLLIKGSLTPHHLNQNCRNEAPAINFFSQIAEEEKAEHPSPFFILKNQPLRVWRLFFPPKDVVGPGEPLKSSLLCLPKKHKVLVKYKQRALFL